jgi:hypothetical protein
VPVLDIFLDLPRVELADVDATVVCDPDMSLAVSGGPEATVDCSESLRLALRALRTVTPDPVVRIYLRRPPCPSLPCSEDQLNTAEVTLWTATQAYSVWLDSRLRTVPLPSVTNDAAWPAAGNSPVPAVARPSIEGAPPEVSRREPYPYCGWAVLDDPLEPLRCFRDAVLAGRRAEVIRTFLGFEGGTWLSIYRYDGHGRIVEYYHNQTARLDGLLNDTWGRLEGAMNLGITPFHWDFVHWVRTDLDGAPWVGGK